MKKAIAQLEFSILIECPWCTEEIDLANYYLTDECQIIAKYIFNNKWEKLVDYELTCPCCDQKFLMEKLEY
jgi:C4-type Zn-finger protein